MVFGFGVDLERRVLAEERAQRVRELGEEATPEEGVEHRLVRVRVRVRVRRLPQTRVQGIACTLSSPATRPTASCSAGPLAAIAAAPSASYTPARGARAQPARLASSAAESGEEARSSAPASRRTWLGLDLGLG